jgi:ATP-dependent protease HslVU (ClpYQ), peptidase subunit
MTTVVATRTSLYSDSRFSFSGAHFNSRKLFQVGDSLLGISGHVGDNLKFVEWFRSKNPDVSPEFSEDNSFDAIELSPEGLFVWDSSLQRMEVLDPFIAVGSGYMAALSALHLGASPEVAIETACKVDRASGGPLQVLHLSPPILNVNHTASHPKGTDSSP